MSGNGVIRVDLHNHTHYSHDSILSPRDFARLASERGLDCIAVTDHNTVRGGLAVREIADCLVIVGEESLTAEGEVLGLFLEKDVPRGLPAAETIARIKDQGGLAGVPHPFDGLRSALDTRTMTALIDQIDFIECLNARIVVAGHNEQALRFAEQNNKPASAGSDAHSQREVGRAYVEMLPFAGPDDFLEALRGGKLRGRLSSPLVHLVSRYAVIRRWLGWRPEAA